MSAVQSSLAARLLNEIHDVICDAEAKTKPLEIEPFRGRLFELFVTAEGAGYVDEDAEDDLTADGVCRLLAERWGLKDAAQASAANQQRLPKEQVARMRLLWSVMRMWMEWTYAWQRWAEFHRRDGDANGADPVS